MFDFAHIPFSRFGRFLTISTMEDAVWLRSVKGGDLRPSLGRLCRIVLPGARWHLSPECLTAETAEGRVAFTIGEGERLHLRGTVPVTFALEGSRYDYAYVSPRGEHCLVAAYENCHLMPRMGHGAVTVTGQWRRDHADDLRCTFSGPDGFEGTLDLFEALPPPPATQDFDAARTEAREAFARFSAGLPPARSGGADAHRLAAYILWSATVPAAGRLTRPAIFMSKNAMINIWSWDNAFSALGVAATDAQLAFDQLAVVYDQQHPSGLMPDFVNDRDVSYAFTKPPVHGWALGLLDALVPDFLTRDRRAYLRDHLALQVRHWLTAARASSGDLPVYCHGNDSGWDNATFFAEGGPVATPDLPTFLILACDMLAELHADHRHVALAWREEGDRLCALLIDRLWNGRTFGHRLAADPQRLRDGQSLIQFMPLLLGRRLPRDIADRLLAGFQSGGWLTPWGVASEAPESPLYESDGYWRGPVWAPTVLLLWDGLRRQGRDDLAGDLAQRFLRLCETSGMAENHDALTGQPLRDRAFAWPAAVYLYLLAAAGDAQEKTG